MTRLKLLLFVILAGTVAVPAVAESAESDYKAGVKAERQANLDAAYQFYKKAHDLKPSDTKYMIASPGCASMPLPSTSTKASSSRYRIAPGSIGRIPPGRRNRSRQLRGPWPAAVYSEVIQRQEREKENAKKNNGQPTTLEREAKNAAGPVSLDIKWDTPISLHLTSTTVDVVYKTIAKIAGINVLIDPDYKPQKINFELQDVSLRQAMEMIAMQSRTFWRPVSRTPSWWPPTPAPSARNSSRT